MSTFMRKLAKDLVQGDIVNFDKFTATVRSVTERGDHLHILFDNGGQMDSPPDQSIPLAPADPNDTQPLPAATIVSAAKRWMDKFNDLTRRGNSIRITELADIASDANVVIRYLLGDIERLRAEVNVDNQLLAERDRLLAAIPECPEHGACIPHAIEWVEQAKAQAAEIERLTAMLHLLKGG